MVVKMFHFRGSIRVLRWVALLFFMTSLSGCFLGYLPDFSDDGTCVGVGDVQIRWVFNSFPVCPDDADTMEVDLVDADGTAVTPEGGEIVCDDREIYLRAVACGNYTVRVNAVDEFGDITWVGEGREVQILGGRVNPITVNLQVAP